MAIPQSAADIRATLAHLLAGAAGGTEEHWASLIEIEVLNIVLNVQGNWRVKATGTADERAAIAEAARLLAGVKPYAHDDDPAS